MVALLNILEHGDHVVSSTRLYGGTYTMFAVNFAKLGIEATLVDPDDPGNFRRALRPNTKAIFSETLGNPAINMIDLEAVGKIAREAGIPFIVDNTAPTVRVLSPQEGGSVRPGAVVVRVAAIDGGSGVDATHSELDASGRRPGGRGSGAACGSFDANMADSSTHGRPSRFSVMAGTSGRATCSHRRCGGSGPSRTVSCG